MATAPPVPEAAMATQAVDSLGGNNAPRMNPMRVFWLFFKFGMRAFGGPVVQIADQKAELVTKGKWITEEKFRRVFSLYQLLPGPEATELACYFGGLAGGRIGGLMGGLGFITPGLLLMLIFSWFYQRYGLGNHVFLSVFAGLQPAMSALMFRACHKISDHAFSKHGTSRDLGLTSVGAMAVLLSVLNVNYFIAKAHLLLVYFCYVKWEDAAAAEAAAVKVSADAAAHAEEGLGGSDAKQESAATKAAVPLRLSSKLWVAACLFWAIAPTIVYIACIAAYGKMDELVPMGMGVSRGLGNTHSAHFIVGLLGGLVTFGGAYTAVPFVEYESVTSGGWVLNDVFLDSLAIANVLPTPLVMFVTMIGFLSGCNMPGGSQLTGLWGALLMTLGMFLPAFAFPLLFHDCLERAMAKRNVATRVLDSIAATVVGQIFVTSLTLLRTAVKTPLQAVIFMAALQTVYNFQHKYTTVLIVFTAGMAGVVLFL